MKNLENIAPAKFAGYLVSISSGISGLASIAIGNLEKIANKTNQTNNPDDKIIIGGALILTAIGSYFYARNHDKIKNYFEKRLDKTSKRDYSN